MLSIESLREFGADTDEGLGRCMNNEQFYLRLVKMAAADAGFDKLSAAVESGDIPAAFEAAHALKGVLGNLSLTPMYESLSELTELLRAGAEADYSAYMGELLHKRARLQALFE